MVIGPGTPGFGAACAGFDLDAIPAPTWRSALH
jgi:hypothetical protein